MSAPDDEEIVASGQALQVVAGWLGIANPQEALEEEPDDQQGQPRPQGLGLGAKFLPHHKGVLLTTGVQQRLGNKLRQSRFRDLPQAEQEQRRAVAQPRRQQQEQRHKDTQAAAGGGGGRHEAGAAEDSNDESEGRGTAFVKRQPAQQAIAQLQCRQQAKPQGFSKADLLTGAGQQPGGKRRGKKRKTSGE